MSIDSDSKRYEETAQTEEVQAEEVKDVKTPACSTNGHIPPQSFSEYIRGLEGSVLVDRGERKYEYVDNSAVLGHTPTFNREKEKKKPVDGKRNQISTCVHRITKGYSASEKARVLAGSTPPIRTPKRSVFHKSIDGLDN